MQVHSEGRGRVPTVRWRLNGRFCYQNDVAMKLYFIQGVRHSAVVMANSDREAILVATKAQSGAEDDKLLLGSVGDWEGPEAIEIKLPRGFEIIEKGRSEEPT